MAWEGDGSKGGGVGQGPARGGNGAARSAECPMPNDD